MSKAADPYGEGMKAFLAKRLRESCAHPEGSSERHDWLAGWDHSARAIREFNAFARRKYEVRGTDEEGDVWTFATDDRARAEDALADMRDDLTDAEMIENP